jgi:hypothetical protein
LELESQVDIEFTASPQEYGYIQGLLAPMKFLIFRSMKCGERRIRIPPKNTSMLRFVLAALASRYEIDTTSHGASDSDSGDMEVDDHATDGGDDEQEEMEDGEEGEGEEEE